MVTIIGLLSTTWAPFKRVGVRTSFFHFNRPTSRLYTGLPTREHEQRSWIATLIRIQVNDHKFVDAVAVVRDNCRCPCLLCSGTSSTTKTASFSLGTRRTEIGNIGICICHEGVYSEVVRGLAMNGVEIIIRPTLIEPHVMGGMWELQNRAHAIFNQVYAVAPNVGPEIQKDGGVVDLLGGRSMIVNHRGAIYSKPVYSKNLYLKEPPREGLVAREEETRTQTIQELLKRGVLTPPLS